MSQHPADATLCHCSLSGEIHVIRGHAGGCESCVPEERRPITPETVEQGLRYYQQRADASAAEAKDLRERLAPYLGWG